MNGPGQLHALIVEPRDDYRAKLETMLRALGCSHVALAADGDDGVDYLRSGRDGFDLVVANLELGGMDGRAFIRHATQSGTRGLVLYAKRADPLDECTTWMARAYRAPLLGVLRLPFSFDALTGLVRRLDDVDPRGGGAAGQGPRREAIDEIAFGLEVRQFVPYYQPKMCLATGQLRGVQASMRWEHPTLGLLKPVFFMDFVERADLAEPLMHLLVDQAASHTAAWAKARFDVAVSVPLSPLCLARPNFEKRLLDTIARAGAPATRFTFEIPGETLERGSKAVVETLWTLRKKGCGIAVDDLGTSDASPARAKRTPVTELKLPGALVRRMKGNAKALSNAMSMLELAHKAQLRTSAEAVDTSDRRRWLASLGCQVGQGELYARPLARARFEELYGRKQRSGGTASPAAGGHATLGAMMSIG